MDKAKRPVPATCRGRKGVDRVGEELVLPAGYVRAGVRERSDSTRWRTRSVSSCSSRRRNDRGILTGSARQLVTVAQLMKEAGLAHGGFYRHFDSREHLVAEAHSAP